MQVFADVVVPLFGIVLLGYGAARLGWFSNTTCDGLSSYVFNFAIPLMLFRHMATLEWTGTMPWDLLASYYIGTFVVFGLGGVLAVRFGASAQERAIVGFGAAFSNTVLLSIPVVLTAFGDEAALPLFSIIAVHSLFLLTTAVVSLELGRGGAELKANLTTSLKGIVVNPVLLGLAAGLLWRVTGFSLQGPVEEIVDRLGMTALPCALFAMGGTLTRYHLAGHLREASLITALKLFVHPILVWLLAAHVFGIEPRWVAIAVVIAAMPTGINVYLFAQRYDAGTAIASSAVVLSTTLSFVTLSALLWLVS